MPVENLPPPGDWNIFTVLIGLGMSAWGGAVSFLHRARRGITKCNKTEFFIELLSSMLAGFIVFLLSIWLGVPVMAAGAFAGIGGHAGTRTIFLIRGIVFSAARRKGENL